MKKTIDNLEDTYKLCKSSGRIKERTPDTELIKSMILVAQRGLAFIENAAKTIPKDSPDWTFVFREHYESLRTLIEAYLLLDSIEADNHQCKNACICSMHPQLELNWEFLETIRLKRNAINYQGKLLRYEDWKDMKLQFSLHISTIKKELEKRLKE